MKKIFSILAMAAVALVGLTGCDSEYEFVSVTGLSVSPTTLSIQTGSYGELTATVTPSDATSKYFTWTSSDTQIASVDNFGRVSGLKPGVVTITAKSDDGHYTATSTVTITAIPVSGITIDKTSLELTEEDTETLKVTVSPSNATEKGVVWTSSDESIATVEGGKVTGLAPGDATITATTVDGGLIATCTVTVKLRIPTEPEVLDLWKSDEAGYRAILGGSDDISNDWLSYSAKTGAVSWTENTTGSIRTATLDFPTGSKITVTQISPADFVGTSWDFRAKIFSNNKNVCSAAADGTVAVKFVEPLDTEELTDVATDKSFSNNIGIKGLYLDAVMDACMIIDYNEQDIQLGLFFDGRKAQKVDNGVTGYEYVQFIPELGGGWISGSYTFVPAPLGTNQNYYWLWFKMGDTYRSFSYENVNRQTIDTDNNFPGKIIIGITCAVCKNASPAPEDVFGTYNVIYQGNPGSVNTTGLYFTKK